MQHSELTRQVIGCAMQVHRTLGPGFLESVYQKALTIELQKIGLHVECEKRIHVFYNGVIVGEFVADMLVQDVLLIENKAMSNLSSAHEMQLVNYLAATHLDIGLLLNFGYSSLQFKRKTRTYRPKQESIQTKTQSQTGIS